MEKIQMKTPLVEMDGDEMTRILWQYIKDELLTPFIDLNTEYYDLGLEYRDKTNDQVTVDAAEATKKYGVAVKCATITANAARVKEYGLKEMWKSPNGTIRAILDGTVFRSPIVVKGIEPCVKNWKKPITLARHAYGDVYKNAELRIPGAGEVKLVYTPADRRRLFPSMPLRVRAWSRASTTWMIPLKTLQRAALSMHWRRSRICGLPQRIRFPRNTTTGSRIFLQRSTKRPIKRDSRPQALNTSIPLLTTPLPGS